MTIDPRIPTMPGRSMSDLGASRAVSGNSLETAAMFLETAYVEFVFDRFYILCSRVRVSNPFKT